MSDEVIHLIQCLCPNRHAIFAVAYDPDELADDVALAVFQQGVEDWIRRGQINPWCGICHSRELHYEVAQTKWKTMAEAEPEMLKAEAENLQTRALIDQKKAEKN